MLEGYSDEVKVAQLDSTNDVDHAITLLEEMSRLFTGFEEGLQGRSLPPVRMAVKDFCEFFLKLPDLDELTGGKHSVSSCLKEINSLISKYPSPDVWGALAMSLQDLKSSYLLLREPFELDIQIPKLDKALAELRQAMGVKDHNQIGLALREIQALIGSWPNTVEFQGASHDLRQPLLVLLLKYDLFEGMEPSKEEDWVDLQKTFYYFQTVYSHIRSSLLNPEQQSAYEITSLVKRFMDQFAFGAGSNFNIENLNPGSLRYVCVDENRTVVLEGLFDGRGEVLTNQATFARALINVFSNALDHNDGDMKILIRTRASASNIEVHVSDNGAGIPKDNEEKIWEKGFTTAKGRNTGHGLWKTRKRLSAVGAVILVEGNDAELGGAHFTIRLPRIQVDRPPSQ